MRYQLLDSMLSEINNETLALDNLRVFSMDDLNNHFNQVSAFDILSEVQPDNFNIHEDFFKYNNNGLIYTLSTLEYERLLDKFEEDIIDYYIDLIGYDGDNLYSEYRNLTMDTVEYEGWSNYDTWLVSINLFNVESNYIKVIEDRDMILSMDTLELLDTLKNNYTYNVKVNWDNVNLNELVEEIEAC